MTKPTLEGGTFSIGAGVLVMDGWYCHTSDADEAWEEEEIMGFGRDYLLIESLPETEGELDD